MGFKLSKVGKIGLYVIIIAIGTYFINIVMPTSSSYAFILFLFPTMLVIGIILLVIGLALSKSGDSIKDTV